MTDKELVEGLIAKDGKLTHDFLFVKCRPLFSKIISYVFNYDVEYDEFVNMVYEHLMSDDAKKLRQFQYKSTLTQFIKVVATNLAIQKRNLVIEDKGTDNLYIENNDEPVSTESQLQARMDLEKLFSKMKNKRYVYVLQQLVIEDVEPVFLAKSMDITVDNLYNIKRRAMKELTRVAQQDVTSYKKGKAY